jgi:hypothetical protein
MSNKGLYFICPLSYQVIYYCSHCWCDYVDEFWLSDLILDECHHLVLPSSKGHYLWVHLCKKKKKKQRVNFMIINPIISSMLKLCSKCSHALYSVESPQLKHSSDNALQALGHTLSKWGNLAQQACCTGMCIQLNRQSFIIHFADFLIIFKDPNLSAHNVGRFTT